MFARGTRLARTATSPSAIARIGRRETAHVPWPAGSRHCRNDRSRHRVDRHSVPLHRHSRNPVVGDLVRSQPEPRLHGWALPGASGGLGPLRSGRRAVRRIRPDRRRPRRLRGDEQREGRHLLGEPGRRLRPVRSRRTRQDHHELVERAGAGGGGLPGPRGHVHAASSSPSIRLGRPSAGRSRSRRRRRPAHRSRRSATGTTPRPSTPARTGPASRPSPRTGRPVRSSSSPASSPSGSRTSTRPRTSRPGRTARPRSSRTRIRSA